MIKEFPILWLFQPCRPTINGGHRTCQLSGVVGSTRIGLSFTGPCQRCQTFFITTLQSRNIRNLYGREHFSPVKFQWISSPYIDCRRWTSKMVNSSITRSHHLMGNLKTWEQRQRRRIVEKIPCQFMVGIDNGIEERRVSRVLKRYYHNHIPISLKIDITIHAREESDVRQR